MGMLKIRVAKGKRSSSASSAGGICSTIHEGGKQQVWEKKENGGCVLVMI